MDVGWSSRLPRLGFPARSSREDSPREIFKPTDSGDGQRETKRETETPGSTDDDYSSRNDGDDNLETSLATVVRYPTTELSWGGQTTGGTVLWSGGTSTGDRTRTSATMTS